MCDLNHGEQLGAQPGEEPQRPGLHPGCPCRELGPASGCYGDERPSQRPRERRVVEGVGLRGWGSSLPSTAHVSCLRQFQGPAWLSLSLGLIPHGRADGYSQETGEARAGLSFLWFLVLSVCPAGASAVPARSPTAFLDRRAGVFPGRPGLDCCPLPSDSSVFVSVRRPRVVGYQRESVAVQSNNNPKCHGLERASRD